jgi:hypothetical protein
LATYLQGINKLNNIVMKQYSLLAFSAMVIFAACSNGGSSDSNNAKVSDSMSTGTTDTMRSEPGMPTSGTSNAGVNLTDTAAVGTNRRAGMDTARKMQDTPHRMKH